MRHEACGSVELRRAGDLVLSLSDRLKGVFHNMTGDIRLLRAELILEEAAEILHALAERDEPQLLDGIVDLIYVTLGTAETYELPTAAGFAEVHRSNMTKGASAATHDGDRGKGAGYVPADIQEVIRLHRAERQES